MNKTPESDEFRSRWGKDKFGKTRNNLLKAIEEVVGEIEGEITPKKIVEFLNRGVTDSEKLMKSTSISRHLAKMCEVGVLEKVRHGVYRLKEDRYRNLEWHMWVSGEFISIWNQRANRKKRQKEYRQLLGIEDGELGDEEELSPDKIEEIMDWNKGRDWEEIEPYVLATKLGISIPEAFEFLQVEGRG